MSPKAQCHWLKRFLSPKGALSTGLGSAQSEKAGRLLSPERAESCQAHLISPLRACTVLFLLIQQGGALSWMIPPLWGLSQSHCPKAPQVSRLFRALKARIPISHNFHSKALFRGLATQRKETMPKRLKRHLAQ